MTDPADLWQTWTAAELAYRDEAAKYFGGSDVPEQSIDQVSMSRLSDLRARLTVAQTSYAAAKVIADANPPAVG